METKKPDPPEERRSVPRQVEQPAPTVGQYAADVKSSGKYRLRSQHLLAGDRLLEAGTEVGTDTPIPWPGPPTPNMEGLDDAGLAAVEKLWKESYNRMPPWDYRANPEYAIHEERRKEQEKETESEPVSHAQAVERDKKWEGPVPSPVQNVTRGGDLTGGVSMPAANVENPNEEQYPKG